MDLNAQVKELLGQHPPDLIPGGRSIVELQAEFVDSSTRILANRSGAMLVIDRLDDILLNKGNAPQGLGRLPGVVGYYDEAIIIIRDLVENRGRGELANDITDSDQKQF